eukprot:12980793-Ditylum_brightwellii.AAC.1
MRFHWLKDRQCQGQFDIQWQHGTANKADYPSKHHPPKMHEQRRSQFLINSVEHNNCKLASAILEGVRNVVNSATAPESYARVC